MSVRVLPSGCIFADKGPTAFVPEDGPEGLLVLLAVMNSAPFEAFLKLQLAAATAAARSYEVGLVQRTPIPSDLGRAQQRLAALAREDHDLQRDRDRTDETTHAFCLPGLVHICVLARDRQIPASPGKVSAPDGDLAIPSEQTRCTGSLLETSLALESEAQSTQARLSQIQAEIDEITFDLYGLSEPDRILVCAEMNPLPSQTINHQAQIVNRKSLIQNLLMWCVGVAFGRWDVRMALNPTPPACPPRAVRSAPSLCSWRPRWPRRTATCQVSRHRT